MEGTQTPSTSNHEAHEALYESGPRLKPIEEPDSWWMWLVYKFTEWTEGTVITPVKVAQARFPESVRQAYETQKLEDDLTISDDLRTLLRHFVSALNGCEFCRDLAEAEAESHEIDVRTLRAISAGEDTEHISERKRAALRYAQVVTENVYVPDEVYGEFEAHFSEREIVEITWLVAIENYYNRISAPLGIGSDGLCSV